MPIVLRADLQRVKWIWWHGVGALQREKSRFPWDLRFKTFIQFHLPLFTIILYGQYLPYCIHVQNHHNTNPPCSVGPWTLISSSNSSVHLRTPNNKACLWLLFPPSAALITIQSECWERQQWWGQCRWMGSILRTVWQHALYVSLHTVGNLLRWEVKWRWMPIVDLPDCLLENTKHGPANGVLLHFTFWRGNPRV